MPRFCALLEGKDGRKIRPIIEAESKEEAVGKAQEIASAQSMEVEIVELEVTFEPAPASAKA